MTNKAYRIVKAIPKRTTKPQHRDPKRDGYERDPHRASFVYIVGESVYCCECYLQYRQMIRARIDAFKAKAVA